MPDIGTARVLITGDYSRLAADFSAAQGVASSGASAIGRSVQAAFTPASLIVDQFGRSIQAATVQVTAATAPVLDLEGGITRLALAQALLKQQVEQANSSLGHQVTEIQAVSGTLRTLESNGGIRAAERFLTLIPGLGEALQFAFPLVGAIALFEVFSRLLGKSEALKKAEEDLAQSTKATDDAFKGMEDTLNHLNVEHITAIFGGSGGKGAEAKVLQQEIQRTKNNIDDLKDSINEIAYSYANSFLGRTTGLVLPGQAAEAQAKMKTVVAQVRQSYDLIQELEGRAAAAVEEKGRLAAQEAGHLIEARIKAQEDASQRSAAITRQQTEASVSSEHAVQVQRINGIEGEYNRIIALGEEEKRYQKAKAADEAGYALALRDRTIQYAKEKAAAESAGKSQPEQAVIATDAAAEIQKARDDYASTIEKGTIDVAKAGQGETLKLVELNQKLTTSLREGVIKAYEDMGATVRRVSNDVAANVEKDATARVRALEEQTKITGAIGRGQGEIAAARLKAEYEQEGVHSLQQEIAYREQLEEIQQRQYTAELTALAARRSDADAITDEVEKSKQLADIDARIAALSAQAQASKIAAQGQIDTLNQNPLQQLQKEFSSIGVKDVQKAAVKDLAAAVHNVSAGLASAIVNAKGFGQAITQAGKQLATALLTTALEAGLKRLLGALMGLIPGFAAVSGAQAAAAAKQKAIAQASVLTAAGEAAAWAFESVMAALPFPVNVAVAPVVAANTFGLTTAIGALAEGTDYARGGLTLIGERGPEIMYIPRGAQVIPNHAFSMPRTGSSGGGLASFSTSKSGAGGGDTHVHIGSVEAHAHGVRDPKQLAELAVNNIPAVLKAKSASFSPYSK